MVGTTSSDAEDQDQDKDKDDDEEETCHVSMTMTTFFHHHHQYHQHQHQHQHHRRHTGPSTPEVRPASSTTKRREDVAVTSPGRGRGRYTGLAKGILVHRGGDREEYRTPPPRPRPSPTIPGTTGSSVRQSVSQTTPVRTPTSVFKLTKKG